MPIFTCVQIVISTIHSGGILCFTFNGKEKDFESGFHYYGARYYESEVLAGWLSVDPMMDKYPCVSPYAYCAWNPVKLVDPDGRVIVIKSRGKSYYYDNGHVYLDKVYRVKYDFRISGEVADIKATLDKINKVNAGHKVLSTLSGSDDEYYITNDGKGNGDGGYSASSNIVYMNGNANNETNCPLRILSHELFHAYQDENNRVSHSIYNEVEAYLFESIVTGDCKNNLGLISKRDPNYNKNASSLLENGFNTNNFGYIYSHFKKSVANDDGVYNSYWYNPGKYRLSDNLISDFLK